MSKKSKRITFNVLYSQLEKDQYPVIDKELKLVTIMNADTKTKDIYRITREYPLELELIDMDLDKMALQLAEKFDPKMLMDEVLRKLDTEQLMDIKERLEKPNVAISSKNRCFSLLIGGKVGAPVELTLIA